mmetsp:Transcript_30834/g.91607  ORF Transcript_30834/g.91607 Transcript_30834/m.91607 type:complete len:245 (+) Transcript_30834:728-1462(+)
MTGMLVRKADPTAAPIHRGVQPNSRSNSMEVPTSMPETTRPRKKAKARHILTTALLSSRRPHAQPSAPSGRDGSPAGCRCSPAATRAERGTSVMLSNAGKCAARTNWLRVRLSATRPTASYRRCCSSQNCISNVLTALAARGPKPSPIMTAKTKRVMCAGRASFSLRFPISARPSSIRVPEPQPRSMRPASSTTSSWLRQWSAPGTRPLATQQTRAYVLAPRTLQLAQPSQASRPCDHKKSGHV